MLGIPLEIIVIGAIAVLIGVALMSRAVDFVRAVLGFLFLGAILVIAYVILKALGLVQ